MVLGAKYAQEPYSKSGWGGPIVKKQHLGRRWSPVTRWQSTRRSRLAAGVRDDRLPVSTHVVRGLR
jgi:hypothetical protein